MDYVAGIVSVCVRSRPGEHTERQMPQREGGGGERASPVDWAFCSSVRGGQGVIPFKSLQNKKGYTTGGTSKEKARKEGARQDRAETPGKNSLCQIILNLPSNTHRGSKPPHGEKSGKRRKRWCGNANCRGKLGVLYCITIYGKVSASEKTGLMSGVDAMSGGGEERKKNSNLKNLQQLHKKEKKNRPLLKKEPKSVYQGGPVTKNRDDETGRIRRRRTF